MIKVKTRNPAMPTRRSLLTGLGTFALSHLLAGCNRPEEVRLRVQMLDGSVPVQLFQIFQRQLQQRINLDVTPTPQLAKLFTLLTTWKQQQTPEQTVSKRPNWLPTFGSRAEAIADLVTLGNYWLAPAIQQGLLQPLNIDALKEWEQLPAPWRSLVTRNAQGQLDENGQVWAAPYRWGTTVIAYRVEDFQTLGWTPRDWSDLWRPELRGYVSLLDSPRETIGLTLKKLGRSVNLENLDSVPALATELAALHQQVKFYSSDAYLQPLLLGDTWVAVGWSTDVLPLLERDRRIAAIVPASGTILTADLWVRPQIVSPEEGSRTVKTALAEKWINFCWQPQTALQFALLGTDASPLLPTLDRADLPKSLQENNLLLPPDPVLQRSEFLNPLSSATAEQYRRLWVETRQMS